MRRAFLAGVAALCVVSGSADAAEWPQFRGPDRQGTSAESGLLAGWAAGQPAELWRRSIGVGYSSVTIAGDRLYTMAAVEGEELVLCLDPSSGDELWRAAVGPSKASDMDDSGPRSSPTVVDGVVYAASSAARLVALSAADGAPLWQRDLTSQESAPRFGYSISPLVDAGQVVVEAGASEEDPGVLALEARTGELRWSALAGPAGYSSPIVVEIAGRRQYVFFRRAGAEVVALSPGGEVLWRHPTAALAIVTMPVFLPPDRIFVASADDVFGGLMLRVSEVGGAFAVEEVWSERLMRNHFNTSVLVDGHLYGFDNGTFRCLDAETGEKKWARRGLGKGSLLAAGDLLFLLGDDGSLVLAPASPEGFREAGRVQAMNGRAWTSPSLAGGRIYMRDFDEIVAYDVRATAPGVATEVRP
jgi:outer membrane protein assembly factor BamB